MPQRRTLEHTHAEVLAVLDACHADVQRGIEDDAEDALGAHD
jgi:hypothetical protein